jgi:hypothetical protein
MTKPTPFEDRSGFRVWIVPRFKGSGPWERKEWTEYQVRRGNKILTRRSVLRDALNEARRLEDEHWDAVRKQLDEFDKVRWYSLEGYRNKDEAEARAGLVRKRTQSVSARDIREAAGENRA